jgi:hypothetical protein
MTLSFILWYLVWGEWGERMKKHNSPCELGKDVYCTATNTQALTGMLNGKGQCYTLHH